MEPRARAGKNVGKMNFNYNELAQLLYGYGDVKNPLPDTVRVLDEITTDFIQGVSFEATRAAHHAGRQKLKFEDFEFAMRKNSLYMGKVQEVFEKKREIERARNIISDEDQILRDANRAERDALRSERRQAAAASAATAGKGSSVGGGGTASVASARRVSQEMEVDGGGLAEEELGEADDDAEAEADALGTKRR